MKKTAKDKGKGAGAEKSSKTSKAAMPSRSSKDTTPGKDAALGIPSAVQKLRQAREKTEEKEKAGETQIQPLERPPKKQRTGGKGEGKDEQKVRKGGRRIIEDSSDEDMDQPATKKDIQALKEYLTDLFSGGKVGISKSTTAAASPDEETDEMMVVLKKIDSTRLKRFLIALHRVTLGDFDLYDAFRLWLPVVLGKSFHMCSGESDYPLYLQTKDLLVSYLPCIYALADGKPEEEAATHKLANVLPTRFAPVKQTLFDA